MKIQRLLPGPVERVWAYLTESELRRTWLAAGEMEMRVGASFEFVWRNDELTDPPGSKPADFGEEHRMQSDVTELDPGPARCHRQVVFYFLLEYTSFATPHAPQRARTSSAQRLVGPGAYAVTRLV